MQVLSLRSASLVAILAIVFLGVGPTDGIGGAHRARSDSAYDYREARGRSLQAKMQYCEDCHGAAGQGYRGFLPIPRLAGQTTEYFENQLRAFVERGREKHSTLNMSKVHGLGTEMQRALAAHFSALNPRPLGGAPRRPVSTGKTIYEAGMPDANVPACSVCHGREAEGSGPIPRLAGQLYSYTVKELVNWDRERGQGGPDTSAVMRPIAHSLTQSQSEAVAAYLSYLE
jgi:cytochrome c553